MNAPAFFPRTETGHYRFTVEDVWRMVEAGVIDPDASLEILDGELISMASEGEVHLTFKARLNRALVTATPAGWGVMPDGTLHLAPEDAPEPDFYIFPEGAALRPVDPTTVALVVEIADSTLAYDLGRKAKKYADYGLSEYWVVDVNARRTHVFRNPASDGYGDIGSVPFAVSLSPRALPAVIVRFDDLVPPAS